MIPLFILADSKGVLCQANPNQRNHTISNQQNWMLHLLTDL